MQQGQERQSQNHEMVALYSLEQLDPRAFQLIATDAASDGGAEQIEVVFEKTVSEPPHAEARRYISQAHRRFVRQAI